MKLYEINVKQFMVCLFDQDYSVCGGKEVWDLLYTDYIDLSGAADTREVTLLRSLHNLEVRSSYIASMIGLQIEFYKNFSIPFKPAFEKLKSFGYTLIWNDDWEDFEKQLKKIEIKEKRRVSEKDTLLKEYSAIQNNESKPIERRDFIRQLNSLEAWRKVAIDEEKTTAEKLALMIKDYHEYVQSQIKE